MIKQRVSVELQKANNVSNIPLKILKSPNTKGFGLIEEEILKSRKIKYEKYSAFSEF